MKNKKKLPIAGRADHPMICFGGKLIPVLGTIGGTKEQSEATAQNIENYFASVPQKKGGRTSA
jgi:hypothetical protein